MYIVSIQNGSNVAEIQNEHYKLFSGKVVQGINGIDSFTFSILPDNPAFGALNDFTTLVSVYNLARQRYEFQGRVLYTSPQMSDEGLLTQEAVCESYLGFLCDSQQEYTSNWNWTAVGLLMHFIDAHNAQVEDYKHFQVGEVDVIDMADKLNGIEVQRGNTWESIKKYLIDELGGEIRFRQENGVNYIDYVKQAGEVKSTEIALSKNMKSIVKEKNPSAFITRLIPLGAKIKNGDGDETEQRVDITSVNNGLNYIDDDEAIAVYGLHVGFVEFDGVTDPEDENYNSSEDVSKPSVVLRKGEDWLKENNKVSIKYSITALDLSLIGLDADDFEVFNTHPLKNSLLGINDTGRIHKKTIDVCDDTKTSIEIGESFKTLSELQREQMVSLGALNNNVANIIRNYVPNQRLVSVTRELKSLIEQTEDRITLEVDGKFATKDDLNGYTKTAEMTTLIEQKVSEAEASITLEVEGKFATKDDLNGYTKTAEMNTLIEQKVSEAEASITLEVDGKFATKDDLNGYASTSEMTTLIEQKVSEAEASITQQVDGKFATKDDLNGYSTTSEMNTTIEQKVSEAEAAINLEASGKYTTKDEFGEFVEEAEASLEVAVKRDPNTGKLIGQVNVDADKFNVESDNFKLGDGSLRITDSDGSKISFGETLEGVRVESSDFQASLTAGRGTGTATVLHPTGISFQVAALGVPDGHFEPIQMVCVVIDGKPIISYVLDGEWKICRQGELSAIASDRNRKNTIETQGDVYSRIFDRLRPVTFKYNNGKSDRIHTGLIAQEVEDAVLAEGLTTKDFAAVCYDEDENGEKTNYAVRYGELVSMCIKEIQDLKAEVARLKNQKTTDEGGQGDGP